MHVEQTAATRSDSTVTASAPSTSDATTLVDGIRAGRVRAIARAISEVERDSQAGRQVVAALADSTRCAHRIGITGPPGAGKSSLVGELIQRFQGRGHRVGVIAVDPSSRTSGGAVLGDRIRMDRNSSSGDIFIRSLGSRGETGGLSLAASRAADVLDAAGYDPILIETVGAGQSEIEVSAIAHTCVVVLPPGLGDDVQAIKAGILEIADVLVVNKADRNGVENTVRGLKTMLELGHPASRTQMVRHHGQLLPTEVFPNGHDAAFWLPPILRTVATDEQGVDEVLTAIDAHREHLLRTGIVELRRGQIEIELYERLRMSLMARFLSQIPATSIAKAIDQVQNRAVDPQGAVNQLLALMELPKSLTVKE